MRVTCFRISTLVVFLLYYLLLHDQVQVNPNKFQSMIGFKHTETWFWFDQKYKITTWSPKLYAKQQGIIYALQRFFKKTTPTSFSYKYIIENKDLCYDPELLGLNMILSLPKDVHIRDKIRSMWGNPMWMPVTKIKVDFILGKSSITPK